MESLTITTALWALAGGALIGLSATLLLYLQGQVLGVSSILAGVFTGSGGRVWRAAFVMGLLAGGLVLALVSPTALVPGVVRSAPALAIAGLLVGFGTRMSMGCTSGHGVCGLARSSKRSLVAVVTFMGTGALTVLGVARIFGGTP
ncbi:YeeE/YedE family protein [Myxococcota bacterium]|nr:YeeE/YedE family protein [Myxococcota bacterium]